MEGECSDQLMMSADGVGRGGRQHICSGFASPRLRQIGHYVCDVTIAYKAKIHSVITPLA